MQIKSQTICITQKHPVYLMLKRSGGEGEKIRQQARAKKNKYNERACCPGVVESPMEQDVQAFYPRHGNGTDGAELWKKVNFSRNLYVFNECFFQKRI